MRIVHILNNYDETERMMMGSIRTEGVNGGVVEGDDALK